MADDQDFVVLDAADLRDFNTEGILPLPDEKIAAIQIWLAPTDYKSGEYKKHLSAHFAGTGEWIEQTDQYQQWHNTEHGALWIKAVAGSPKSVVIVIVVF